MESLSAFAKAARGRPWLAAAAAVTGLGVLVGLVGLIVVSLYVVRVTDDLPEIADLAAYEPPVMSRVHAGDGRLIAEYARESRVFVPIGTIPPHVIAAFISAEDKNFYQHGGLDYFGTVRGVGRSLINKLRGTGGLQSGSTITQQVAKNFKLTAEQTIERKVKEMVLARRLERTFSKDQILELYLNEIYLGRRAYGVAAASLLYFGKSLDDLTLSEAAYLAALPKAPNNYHPIREKARAISRRNYVLGRMAANGYVSKAEIEAAAKEDLIVSDRLTGATYAAADYFVEEVRRLVFSMYGEDELYDGGLSIRTTLDTRLQVAAQEALRNGLEAYDRRHGYRGPITAIDPGTGWETRLAEVESPPGMRDTWRTGVVLELNEKDAEIGLIDGSKGRAPLSELTWARRVSAEGLGPAVAKPADALRRGEVILIEPLETEGTYGLRQIPAVNGALMAMDPHTGRVLAIAGGYSYRLSQFNRATQARRQPGSSFKPFVYAAALDAGFTPVDRVLDAPYVSPNPDAGFYKPQNYTGRWYGLSTLRLGIEKSRNAMTVRLANDISLERVSAYGERFGIYDDLPPYEAMALGAGETTLWRMASAYAALVNGGIQVTPTILDRVQDRDGLTIYRHDERVCAGCMTADLSDQTEPVLPVAGTDVLEPTTAYQIVSMLEGVVQRGSGTRVKAFVSKPIAGKTGTTNDFRDAWFMGFSPDLVAGVYIGFDTPKPLGEGEAGGAVAAPIFGEFMAAALKDQPSTPFRVPPGVRLVKIDPETGVRVRPDASRFILEAFKAGTEPTQYASVAGGFSGYASQSGGPDTLGGISIGGGAVDTPIVEPEPTDPGAGTPDDGGLLSLLRDLDEDEERGVDVGAGAVEAPRAAQPIADGAVYLPDGRVMLADGRIVDANDPQAAAGVSPSTNEGLEFGVH